MQALVVIDQSTVGKNINGINTVFANETEIDYELIKTQMRSLHSSMTGLSIIISLGLAVLYTEDPIPPNVAERQRTEAGLILNGGIIFRH